MNEAHDLSPIALPADADAWPSWVEARCSGGLDEARRLVRDLKASSATDVRALLQAWNDINVASKRTSSAAGLFAQVHPDEKVRTQAEAAEQEASRLATDLTLDRDLYELFTRADAADLDDGAARVLAHTLRDFRRAGVDRDEATRARLRELAERETVLSQQIAKNTRDSVITVRLQPDRLRGLPADYVDAHPVDDDDMVSVTTDYPDVYPFLSFAEDRAARREVLLAFNNRAWPDNDALLVELLDLRAEHAQLLGYDGWPDYDAEVKMIGNGAAIARSSTTSPSPRTSPAAETATSCSTGFAATTRAPPRSTAPTRRTTPS